MRPGLLALVVVAFFNASRCLAADPTVTVVESKQVLAELVTIPGNEIPAALLADAQGLAIVPRVIKVGFGIGARRGHGVVLVRDARGNWSLPRFVTLTGGSLGWQVGVQGTDVVLVFTTRRSVDGLLNGKFTIGVDAAAAAGPVGRNAAAATDTSLRAEILSYSRSRGLFLGASIDGSAIELSGAANAAFYGSPDPSTAQTIPTSAIELQSYVTNLTASIRVAAVPSTVQSPVLVAPASANGVAASGAAPAIAVAPTNTEVLRRSLVESSEKLSVLLTHEWKQYLALPPGIEKTSAPELTRLDELMARFDSVTTDPRYKDLTQRSEFQTMRRRLHDYVATCKAAAPTLALPEPPVGSAR